MHMYVHLFICIWFIHITELPYKSQRFGPPLFSHLGGPTLRSNEISALGTDAFRTVRGTNVNTLCLDPISSKGVSLPVVCGVNATFSRDPAQAR